MRQKTSMLAAWVFALALVGAMHGTAAAQESWNNGYIFRDKPKMNSIPNSDVMYERKASGYDHYRYANTWYVVADGTWYRSYSWQGPYLMVDLNEVPDEVTTVPGNYRRYWDLARVEDRDMDRDRDRDRDDDRDRYVQGGMYAWPGSFSRKPSMHNITASGVSYSRHAANGNIDFYKFRSTYYLVDGGSWYRAESWRGPFISVSASSVPREVLRVPSPYRRHWMAPARD
jgi:hypothetical protein